MRILGKRVSVILSGGLLLVTAVLGRSQQTNADFELGKQKYEKSDWPGAIMAFSKSIDGGFDLYNSYSYRAWSKAMVGDSNGAVADCNEVIKLDPNFAGGYYWRSRVETELTNYFDAARDFEIGLKLNPKTRPADIALRLSFYFDRLGWKKVYADDVSGALVDMDRGIYICPTNGSIYGYRGYLKLLRGSFGGAIADACVSIKYSPKTPYAYQIRALARYELHDTAGAKEDCAEALKIYAKLQTEDVVKNLKDRYWTEQSLLIGGLQNYINGDFQTAADQWSAWLETQEKTDTLSRAYFKKWIERAKSKLLEIPASPNTNSLPAPDTR